MHKEQNIALIIEYIQNAFFWHQAGETREIHDGPGLRTVELEEEILTAFGLPPNAFCYSELLQLEGFSLEDIEMRAEAVYHRLLCEATSFLLSSPQTDTTFLSEARKEYRNAGDVLPFLGFTTTAYANFLFYDIYLPGQCSEVELLQHLKAAESYDIPDQRHIPYKMEQPGIEKSFWAMQQFGLAFVNEYREYLEYLAHDHDWSMQPADAREGIDSGDYNGLVIELFYITNVEVMGPTQCIVDMMVAYKSGYRKIKVWCFLDMLYKILTAARYYSLLSALTLNLDCLDDDSYPFQHDAMKLSGTHYEISKCVVELSRMDLLEENGVFDLLHFSVKSIFTIDEIMAPFENEDDEFPF